MKLNFGDFYKDVDELYAWVDSITSIKCPTNCVKCCEREVIWLTLPELVRMYTEKTPKEYMFGCPYRVELENGGGFCGNYEHRPLVCRSYGLNKKSFSKKSMVSNFMITLDKVEYTVFGPGVCDLSDKTSSTVLKEMNQIYTCYAKLSEYGLVAMGTSKNQHTQKYVEDLCKLLQKIPEINYQVYCKNGIPRVT
jgi:Fe-S-cluster containining protein